MALTIATVDANGNSGVVCGRSCHPSGLASNLAVNSMEICLDLAASPYVVGGFPIEEPLIYGRAQYAELLLGPKDPYGEPLVPRYGFHLTFENSDGTFPRLKVRGTTGTEKTADWVAPAGTYVWIRVYYV